MHLYRLGSVSWQDSQLVYHALAHLGREGLILCSPSRPYVSVGYSQDPAQELDLAFCQGTGLPIFRREVGGGAVYLDRHQLFWQVVLRREHPLVSLNRRKFYDRLLAPLVAAYQALGVPARVAPVNDVAVGRRRIAGTGAGEIGDCVVFVGNIMRRFDCGTMARALRTPNREFRLRFQDNMEQHLTSLRLELGERRESALSDEGLYDLLAEKFKGVLGPLQVRPLDARLRGSIDRLSRRMLSPGWTFFRRKARAHRRVTVRAGLFLHHWQDSGPCGNLEATFTSQDGKVLELCLKGDMEKLQDLEKQMQQKFIGSDIRGVQKFMSSLAQKPGRPLT